jgi:parallel beta-helix repeat protein
MARVVVIAMLVLLSLPRNTLATTYYVSATGNDTNTGRTQALAFKTLQRAVTAVVAGDSVLVLEGTYKGFDIRKSGTSADPIVFKALAANVIINTPNSKTNDGINVENANWVVIEGFSVNNQPRNGIRVVTSDHVVLRKNVCDANYERGILTGFANDILIEGNVCTNAVDEHGIYVSNSGDRPVVRNNICHHNRGAGIQMNADASLGGDGTISDGVIEGNILYENGKGGGAAINLDGAVNTKVYNNLLYNNHATGIALFKIDAASGSKNCKVFNNTIINASDARWCVLIVGGSTGVTLYNNILINQHSFRGSIAIDNVSLSGFISNYNILVNRLSNNNGETAMSLTQWQALGYDQHSMVASSMSTIFVDSANGNYHLKENSQAIDKGTPLVSPLVTVDIDDVARPSGIAYDIGAYEYSTASPPPPLAIKINFQPSASTVPEGYRADVGSVFGDRLNGYTYGWNVINNNTRDRKVSGIDVRYNTFNYLKKPVSTQRRWEIALPNGTYQVIVGCGDPSFTDHVNNINIENVIVNDTDGKDNYDEYTTTVTVSDGRLTIRPATGALNPRVNFIEIMNVNVETVNNIENNINNRSEIGIYPNPVVTDELSVQYNAIQSEKILITVFDEVGNKKMEQWRTVTPGINNVVVKMQDMAQGRYVLKIRSATLKKEYQQILIKE